MGRLVRELFYSDQNLKQRDVSGNQKEKTYTKDFCNMDNVFENTKPLCSYSQSSLIIPHCPAAFLPLKLGSSLFLEGCEYCLDQAAMAGLPGSTGEFVLRSTVRQ